MNAKTGMTVLLLVAGWLASGMSLAASSDMHVFVDDKPVPFHTFALFPLPGETLTLEPRYPPGSGGKAVVSAKTGTLTALPDRSWQWQAPQKPGLTRISIIDSDSGHQVTLNVFVLTPADHSKESLQGYRIGRYQVQPLRGQRTYERPDGFVAATSDNRAVQLSPNFTLQQFLCKQNDGPPDFVIVEQRLLIKLEAILAELRARGFSMSTLHVMSGFRTPWYNRSIGNTTVYSRHLYGDAADIFVDADDDGMMDDLDGDGRITRADAEYLADVVQQVTDRSGDDSLKGGLGIYGPASHRGPFVHVDVRGYAARW